MKYYRVLIARINNVQLDVEVADGVDSGEMEVIAQKQAIAEYGPCDECKVEYWEQILSGE